MTIQFNTALSEEHKTNFNEIIKDFIDKLQQTNKQQKRKSRNNENNENNENSKRQKFDSIKEMTFEELFMNNNKKNNNNKNFELLPPLEHNYNGNGGGNKVIIRSKNIYTDVFKYIPIEEFKKLIEKEITIRPIEKIFREYKKPISSKRMKTYIHQGNIPEYLSYTPAVVAYGGTYKYKYKYKNNNYKSKSKKTKKNSYKSKRTKKYNKKQI
jgi:hypothetical protein